MPAARSRRLAGAQPRRPPASGDARRIPVGVWLLVFAAPAYARRLYTSQNLVAHEIEWELAQALRQPGPVLMITTRATMPYLLHRVSAINTPVARTRTAQIAWHLREGTFRTVLVSQVLRPTTAGGDAGIDPDDVLPPEFKLEPIERKRFGMRWIRISRLIAVEVEPAAAKATSDDSARAGADCRLHLGGTAGGGGDFVA